MRLTVSIRNAGGVAANFHARNALVQRNVRAAQRENAEREYRAAAEETPVDTGRMLRLLTIEVSPSGLVYAVGWLAVDFEAEGVTFYVPFVLYGTRFLVGNDFLTAVRDRSRAQNRETVKRAIVDGLRGRPYRGAGRAA